MFAVLLALGMLGEASSKKEIPETPHALLKRLQHSALLGQPLLPLILHNNNNIDFLCVGHQRGSTRRQATFWESSPSVASPSSIFASKSLHTVQRLVLKQWAPRAINGSDLLKECLANRCFLSTGIDQFDSLLSGGCLTGEITEVFGPSAVGKSQICHFIAAATSSHRLMQADALTTALVESKGSTVLYLDTKGDFCASRIRQLVCSLLRRRFGLANTNALERSTDHCLSRVWCRLVPGVQQLMDALVETRLCVATAALLEKTAKTVRLTNEEATFYSNLRLVIVDCIASPFVPFTSAFPNETTFQLRSVATELRRISADFHIAVLVTNNVRYGVDVPRPCLGEFWSSVPRVSIYMHSDEHRSPSRACVEVKRDLRYNCGLEAQSNSAYCVIDFRDSWEDLQH